MYQSAGCGIEDAKQTIITAVGGRKTVRRPVRLRIYRFSLYE